MISTLIRCLGIKDTETAHTARLLIELIFFCVSFLLFLISLSYLILNY